MERLTKLDTYGNPYTNEDINCRNLVSEDGINYKYVGYVDNFKAFDGKPIDKLSKLEDLEDELGISLEVLFKALKDGIWIINKEYVYDGYHIEAVLIGDKYNKFLLQDFNYDVWELKDYGKTWSLTREELEK